MAASTLIPVCDYLNTSYDPDCDYIDGELKERHVGERPHSLLQALLASIFLVNYEVWNVLAMTEQRVQTSKSRFRIPDLCIVRRSDPNDLIVRTAPLLCIEILSREDSLGDLQEKVDDYSGMGVEQVWVIDPVRRIGYMSGAAGFVKPANGELTVTGTPIVIVLSELFARIDALQLRP